MKLLHKERTKHHSVIDFIINCHQQIEIAFGVVLILSLLCVPFVKINYDLTEYLPDFVQSKQGIDLMKKEFGYPGTAQLMIEDVTIYQAKSYKDKIQQVDGVDQVLWCDSSMNLMMPEDYLFQQDLSDYFKDNCAVMNLTFVESDSSHQTSVALTKIQEITGSKGRLVGPAMQNKSLQENIPKEVAKAMVFGVIMILVVLCLSTTSWIEPVMFLSVMGIAILINKGTNIFLGTISFLTDSVSSILQLAVAMDYSIFLLHSFTREKLSGVDQNQALANAVRGSVSSILASGATTIVGFIVLTLMKFSIGFDMGIVLAKGIVISLLTVLFLMPALILRFSGLVEKTAHRSFLPSFQGFSKAVYRIRYGVLILALVVAVPAYVGQNMNNFMYGNGAVGAGKGTQVYEDDLIITEKFGRSNMMMAIVPNTTPLKEKDLADKLEQLPYITNVTSLSKLLPEGIPEDFLPSGITSNLHTKDSARILLYLNTKEESSAAFQASDEIQAIVTSYYPENSYVVGATPSTQDIKETITKDYSFVNMLSLIGVFLVVLVTFKSILIPALVLVPIEIAIFINMTFPYLVGDQLVFIGYIIVSCIQLGATVDYSILTTNNYMDARANCNKKEAMLTTLRMSTPSILTSGLILTIVGYILHFTSSIAAVGDMGHLIGRGALLSMVLVLTLLPALLALFDPVISGSKHMTRRLKKLQAVKRNVVWLSPQYKREARRRRLRKYLKKH